MSQTDQALELVSVHGMRAPQMLVDQIVGAVKAGDEARMLSLDALLKAVDRVLEAERQQR